MVAFVRPGANPLRASNLLILMVFHPAVRAVGGAAAARAGARRARDLVPRSAHAPPARAGLRGEARPC